MAGASTVTIMLLFLVPIVVTSSWYGRLGSNQRLPGCRPGVQPLHYARVLVPPARGGNHTRTTGRPVGVEPTTDEVEARRSSTELRPQTRTMASGLRLVRAGGLEPPALRLRVSCSAIELRPQTDLLPDMSPAVRFRCRVVGRVVNMTGLRVQYRPANGAVNRITLAAPGAGIEPAFSGSKPDVRPTGPTRSGWHWGRESHPRLPGQSRMSLTAERPQRVC